MHHPFGTFGSVGRKNSIWRLLIGVILTVLIWLLWAFVVLVLGALIFAPESLDLENLPAPLESILLLLTFWGIWIGLWVACRLLHKQKLSCFFSDACKSENSRTGALLFLGVTILTLPLIYVLWGDQIRQTAITGESWLVLVVPAICLIAIQATAEELLFRGYLLQKLSLLSKSWLVWALIPSILFGMIHLETDMGRYDQILRMISAGLTGLFFCTLVWRTGSLWGAVTYHVLTNISALVVLGLDDAFSGIAPWVLERSATRELLYFDICLSVALIGFVLSKWGDFLGKPRWSDVENS